jgi:hypothetical protein
MRTKKRIIAGLEKIIPRASKSGVYQTESGKWKCFYCIKEYEKKISAVNHEKQCQNNQNRVIRRSISEIKNKNTSKILDPVEKADYNPETAMHVILECPFLDPIRKKYINLFGNKNNNSKKILSELKNNNPEILDYVKSCLELLENNFERVKV